MNSVLRKRILKSLTPNTFSPFSTNIGGLLSARLSEGALRNAIRFENQNKTWTFKELEQHSNAVAYGLLELGYKKGDRILLWVDRSYTSEITATQIGSAKIGVTLVPLLTSSEQDLEKGLKDSDCKGVLFSANTKSGGKRRADILNGVFPELESTYSGNPLSFSKYPNLKHLINVGFHTLPGTFKFRQLLVYANPNFTNYRIPTDLADDVPLYYAPGEGKEYTLRDINDFAEKFRSQNDVKEADTLAVSGSPCCPGTFAAGAYQNLAYGNYVVLYGNDTLKDVVEKLKIQQPSTIVINQQANQEDLQAASGQGSIENLRRILVSGKDTNQYQNVFGGKNVSSFNAYW